MKIGKKFKYFSFAVLLGAFFTAKCDVVSAATWKTVADTLPDEVTVGTNWVSFKSGTDITNTASISNYPSLVSAVSGYQLYCSDRNRGDLVPGTTLVKGDRMEYGLAYILSNSLSFVNCHFLISVLHLSIYLRTKEKRASRRVLE